MVFEACYSNATTPTLWFSSLAPRLHGNTCLWPIWHDLRNFNIFPSRICSITMTLTQILGCMTNFSWFSNATAPTSWLTSLALKLYVETCFWPIRHDLRNFDVFTKNYAIWPIPSLNPAMNDQFRRSLLQPDDSDALVKPGCSWAPYENWFQPDPA